jgi:hypothetical protein
VLAQPLLKPSHWSLFEPNYLAKLEYYEWIHVGAIFLSKNLLHTLIWLTCMTSSVDAIIQMSFLNINVNDSNYNLFKYVCACLLMTLLSLKLVRDSFCEPSKQYKLLVIAYLVNQTSDRIILIDLYLISIVLSKFCDLLEKLKFIYVYTAPWQLPWGSAFHAFAQPLAMPHTSLLLCQAVISACIGAPLMPLMGSAIFLMSYMRPIKFWEYDSSKSNKVFALFI